MSRLRLIELSNDSKSYIENLTNYLLSNRYSENTIQTYRGAIETYLRFNNNPAPEEINPEAIANFNINYILKRSFSESYQNQCINAIKLFLKVNIGSKIELEFIERPKNSYKLPTILSQAEVELLLKNIFNTKHRSIIGLIYSCGLRSGELIQLRIADIDSNRMVIHIRNAKGKKDRLVPLPESILELLRVYYLNYRPVDYLFNGKNGTQYSYTSLRSIFNQAVKRSGIQKKCTLHTLRHSYATHLLESGVNLRYIQELLGHNSPKTTMIYTHVSTEASRKITSPIEKMNFNKK